MLAVSGADRPFGGGAGADFDGWGRRRGGEPHEVVFSFGSVLNEDRAGPESRPVLLIVIL